MSEMRIPYPTMTLALQIFCFVMMSHGQSNLQAGETDNKPETKISIDRGKFADCSLRNIKAVKFELKIESFLTRITADSDNARLIRCYRIPEAPQLVAVEWDRGTIGTYTYINHYELLIFDPSKSSGSLIYKLSLGNHMQAPSDPPSDKIETRKYSFKRDETALWIVWPDTKDPVQIVKNSRLKKL